MKTAQEWLEDLKARPCVTENDLLAIIKQIQEDAKGKYATYTVELVPYTVKTGPGWRSAVRIVDNSSIPFTGKAFVRRRIFGTVWANKADALERAEREAATIHETNSIP